MGSWFAPTKKAAAQLNSLFTRSSSGVRFSRSGNSRSSRSHCLPLVWRFCERSDKCGGSDLRCKGLTSRRHGRADCNEARRPCCPRKCVGDKRAAENSTQSLESPIQLPIGRDFHRRDAGRLAALRLRDATRIQETHACTNFIPRDMGMTMQQNIDVLRWLPRRNMDQTESKTVAFQINHQRPSKIAIAISPNDN